MNAPEQLYVLREDQDALATITMNRGERFNPLSSDMIVALSQTFDAIAQDKSVRVVVLQGNGRGFCAGHDLKEMQNHAQDSAWIAELFRSCSELMMRITQMPQPVIAKVH
ncbi:MAG: enoyl-CoA hydratase, partial [Betaproteobacteria bacterium]|nr:enoyl-CoA hydratase [Betaproteobacteria bacterium]